MATPSAPVRRPSNIGVSPTKQEKLIYIAKALGLPGIAGMQGSTVNIFDTVALSTNTDRQTLSFFSQTSNKSRSFSNFQSGVLNAGEAMIAEEITFVLLTLSGSDLTATTTAITSYGSITSVSSTAYPDKGGFALGLLNFTIANSKVVKDLNTFEQDPLFNPRTTGITAFDTATATNVRAGESKIYLEAPPVIPPNQKINITLEIGATGTIPANSAVMCIVGRFGTVFSAKTTL